MKQALYIMALILVMGASFNPANAQKKKKQKKEDVEVAAEQPLKPVVTRSDSVSYAAGMNYTIGLMPYLQRQAGVDSTQMGDFIRGFQEYLKHAGDPTYKAYAAGLDIASQVSNRMLPDVENRFKDTQDVIDHDMFFRGFIDALHNDTTVFKTIDGAGAFFQATLAEDIELKNEKLYGPNREAGIAYLAENAKDTTVHVMPSGLQYKILTAGTGDIPKATETVKVKYEGRLIDGTVFDSSARHGDKPVSFRANQVIKGWTEALTMMPVGSKWTIWIPQELAYAEREQGQIKPFSALVFDVELVEIEGHTPATMPEATPAPATTKKPATAKKKKRK
jgi:FKBP-type peptidyl-prolyl cis-trans isomerase FklB